MVDLDMSKHRKYVFLCGHNNGAILNVWPFKTWVCFECGFKSDIIKEVG